MPVLKAKYDLIIFDTSRRLANYHKAADEAADGILVAVSPRNDYASTTDFMLTISERFRQSPNKVKILNGLKLQPLTSMIKAHTKK